VRKKRSIRPVTRGGRSPLENCSSPLEKCIEHNFKILGVVQKPWAPLGKLFSPPGVPSWLRSCAVSCPTRLWHYESVATSAPQARIPRSHVTANASPHDVIPMPISHVFVYFTTLFSALATKKLAASSLQY